MKKAGKVFALSILTIFFLAIISSVFVSAESNSTVGKEIVNWLSNTGVSISEPTQNFIAKALLMTLVILMVYSISSFIPIFPEDNEWIPWVISIIVGFLSFVFVSSENIKLILNNYEALGIVLTSILPLIIIIVFNVKLRESSVTAAGFFNKLIIVGFIIYLGVKWINTSISNIDPMPELVWVYPLTVIVSVIWLLIEKKLWKYFNKEKRDERKDKANETVNDSVQGAINLKKIHRGFAGSDNVKS
jgi:hypothetical protein